MVNVPLGADRLTFRVSVLVVVAGLGLNEAVTPLGSPEADKVTLDENPFKRLMVMELVPLAPRATLRLLGNAERLKSGGGVEELTVSVRGIE